MVDEAAGANGAAGVEAANKVSEPRRVGGVDGAAGANGVAGAEAVVGEPGRNGGVEGAAGARDIADNKNIAGKKDATGAEAVDDVGANVDAADAGGAGASEAGVAQDSAVEVVFDGPVAEPVRRMSPELERRLDLSITIGGLVVVTLLALVLALIEAFFAPFRLNGSGVRIPISLVLALVTNPLLGWFAFTTTGRRLAALLPAGAWCVVWILAAGRTSEGDLLLTEGNWVGLLTLFAGPLAFAVGIYVSALRRRPGNSKPGTLAPQSVDR
ncbi:hypothetical protein ABZS66_33580 [Dactylosporangium sp. NPDC005572]|uniref:hypothetical protein n=1 Tax=Dactylosporangium sp. NPDC005572 TaxID=3156889 RepID=UPI0033A8BEAF